jgi:hypothetical protein
MLFSVLALLVVVAVVMKLSATQLQAVKAVSPAGTTGAPAANANQRAVDLVNKAIEQGAAQRAADAASQ